MIGSIRGKIRHKDLTSLTIDVSGVGYKVMVPTEIALYATLEKEVLLWTHLVVRENALELFGFTEKETLDAFELLITISGIGPKSAIGILNIVTVATLRQAVASGDTSYLTRVSGVGKKNAEKIVLELKNKLKTTKEDESVDTRIEGDALEALVSLGYSERDAREALKQVSKEISGTAERVKGALKLLSKHA